MDARGEKQQEPEPAPRLETSLSSDKAEVNPGADEDTHVVSKGANMTISKDAPVSTEPTTTEPKQRLRLWLIVVSLSFTSLLTSMDATITSTALPSIIADLGGGDLYVWSVNGYFLSM